MKSIRLSSLKRIKSFLGILQNRGVDACFVQNEDNIFYFLGEKIEGALLIMPQRYIIITDRRYREELAGIGRGFGVEIAKNYFDTLRRLIKRYKVKSLGIEENKISAVLYEALSTLVTRTVPLGKDIEDMRMVKDSEEISRIRKAIDIAGESFSFLQDILIEGRTEKSLEAELVRFSLLKGAEEPSFPPIVLSGERTSIVHGRPSARKLMWGEHLLVDFGVKYKGYCSDLTRIFCLGRIAVYIKDTIKLILEAQQFAFRSIKPGSLFSSVEAGVRRFFKKHRREKFFYHSLGHGVGINIHEKPFFSEKNMEAMFKEGMVITVEPGLYFEGKFGVRIEDMVLVKKRGVEILSGHINKSI